jgi:hypothetical protein
MNAIGIIHPQYWKAFDVKSMFANHLAILKALLCHPKPIGPNGTLVVNFLHNHLIICLNPLVKMCVQEFYKLETFSFYTTIWD